MGCKTSAQVVAQNNEIQQNYSNEMLVKSVESSRQQQNTFFFSRKLPESMQQFGSGQSIQEEHSVSKNIYITQKNYGPQCDEFSNFSYEQDLEILEFLGKGGYGKVYKA